MTTDIEYEILQLTRKAMVKAKESPGNQATLKKVLEDYLDDKKSALTNHLEPVASQNNVHIISDSEDENEKEEEDDEDLLTSQSTQDPLRIKQKGRPKIRTNPFSTIQPISSSTISITPTISAMPTIWTSIYPAFSSNLSQHSQT
jgi:hypothetical protein